VTDQSTRADQAAAEVTSLARDLIRFDTSNYGDRPGPGERAAAEWVAAQLEEVGLATTVLESEPGRTSVVTRIAGSDPARGALLVHGHLDVVPADKADWQVDPFVGEIRDGMLWGRGAVDMKDVVGMTLAVARAYASTGTRPPRDLVLAFVADEEAGGAKGAHFLVDQHPDLFEGCTEAISEVGGFSVSASEDLRLYLVETAQKGMSWLRLTARGTAGHGSMTNPDNAVTALCEAVARLGRAKLPLHTTATVSTFLDQASEALGLELDPDDLEATVAKLGPIARIIGATLRNTATPTMLDAGYKVNVIPGTATAYVDGRFLPGFEAEFERELDEVLGPDIARERCPTACPAAPTPRASPRWACAASASRRCGCQPTWTSAACSTGWTSGCRWTAWSSVPGCSPASSTPVRPLNGERRQRRRVQRAGRIDPAPHFDLPPTVRPDPIPGQLPAAVRRGDAEHRARVLASRAPRQRQLVVLELGHGQPL